LGVYAPASPPDVRRGSAPPVKLLKMYWGYAPRCGLRSDGKGKAQTGGIAVLIVERFAGKA